MCYDRKLVGKNLRCDRRILGWTQKKTAERARLSLSFYQKLERGESDMTLRTLMKLCHTLYIRPTDLFSSDPAARGPHPACVARAILDLPHDQQEIAVGLILAHRRNRRIIPSK